MAKKIKNQIKRSMPLFIIVCMLCSSFAVGLVFNYDISLSFDDNKLSLSIDKSEAQAQNDFATTTVTVKNAPPTFTIEASEVVSSTSTSPVNMGYSIGFTARANDVEDNDYYLIICDQAGVTASTTGGAPTCDNTTLCVSGNVASDADASCTYSGVVDPTSIGGADDEIQDWYAYVCDDHSLEAVCSDSYSQGTSPNNGDNSSPFYVNHAPVFTAIATPVDNQEPGASNLFTVTASVTDVDTREIVDDLTLAVCQTDSWSTSTGCTVELCTATSTTPDISCQFATSTAPLNWVAKDGTYNLYAFVKDWHEMPAVANSRTGTYTVVNVAPVVSGVNFNDGGNITLNLKTAPEVVVTASGTITDINGCADLDHATSTIYWSGSSGWNCDSDDDECYQIGSSNCVQVSGSCGIYPDSNADYVCTTTLAFHAIPTDIGSSNPNSGTWWEAAISGFDESLIGTASSAVDTVDVSQAPGLDVNEATIPFGSIRGNEDSGAVNATTTVENYGNTPLDTTFEGNDMVRQGGGGYIGADQQEYDLGDFVYGFGSWTLASGTASVARDLDLPKPTTALELRTDDVMWGINVPAGKLSGIYEGSNIFRSAVDTLDW